MLKDRSKLTTEKRNVRTRDIDKRSTLEIIDIINSEDRKVAPAVAKERKAMAKAVDLIVESFHEGGRLFYVGAGTSGRLGVLDASECPPTFGTDPEIVQGVIAWGPGALIRAVEGAEDSRRDGARALKEKGLNAADVVVGIATCGITPYVLAAIEYARRIKAGTIFIACSPESIPGIKADVIINPVVGPEVITGSTRMKAGTATKLVLNTLTTTAMIKLGKVYGNLMVDLKAGSDKLRDRAERIVMQATGLSRQKARKLLSTAEGLAKVAIVMHFRKLSADGAGQLLTVCGGSLRKAIEGKR